MGRKPPQVSQLGGIIAPARQPREGGARARRQSAPRHPLRRPLHRARVHRALCPVTGQPDFAHLVIDYVPDHWLVESKSLKLYLARSATTAPSTRTAPSPSASASPPCSSRTTCASAATGIRAAACRSTCSGRRARCPRACGCPTRASRPTAGAADPGSGPAPARPAASPSVLRSTQSPGRHGGPETAASAD